MTEKDNKNTDDSANEFDANPSKEGPSRLEIHEIEHRLDKNENELEDLRKKIEEKGRDWLGILAIVGRLLIATVLAIATYLGATVIPETINRQSLESQKIIHLSELVPKLYSDSTAANRKPILISMASHGVPAVPFLLLALEDANENDDTELIQGVISAMKYMDDNARNEINSKLGLEISQLREDNLGKNVHFMCYIIDILDTWQSNETTQSLLERYFIKVSVIDKNKRKLKELNGTVLNALAKIGTMTSRLPLAALDFEGQDLSGIDFSQADLSQSNLANCKLTDCTFEGTILDLCNLEGATFFLRQHDSHQVLGIFKNLSKAQWQNAYLDSTVCELLSELTKENGREATIFELTKTLMDEI
ncbi:MAG: pentapeptide repeat-containing protein [candidate division Zixibacteria bacterium]